MKTFFNSVRTGLLVLLASCGVSKIAAQEDELITVYFHGTGHSTTTQFGPDTGTITMSIVESKTVADPSVNARTQTSTAFGQNYITTPWRELRVEVGRIYHIGVTADQYVIEESLNFEMKTPPGYYWDSVNQSGPYVPGTHMFRVLPDNVDKAPRRAGEAERLTTGRTSWGVSLGARGNGSSAGSIRLIDVGFESSWAGVHSPAGLKIFSRLPVYDTPSGASSPYVVGAPRQMMTPEAMVDIVPVSTTEYELRFYDASQFSGSYPYDVTGKTAYVVYNIKKPGSSTTELQITKTAGSRTEKTVIGRSGSFPSYTWTVDDWHNTSESSIVQTVDTWSSVSGSDYASSVVLKNPVTSAVAAESLRSLDKFAWGEAPDTVRTGPSGDSLVTDYEYYTDANDEDSYSRLKSVTYPSDAWEGYEYYGQGESGFTDGGFRVHRPYVNSPSSVPSNLASNTSGEITSYWFAPRAADDKRPLRLAKVEKTINGTLAGKTEFEYYDPTGASTYSANSKPLVRATRYDWTENNSGTRLRTVTRYYDGTNDGLDYDQVLSIERPDKSKTAFAYHTGSWSGSSFTPGAGSATRVAVVYGTIETSGTSAAGSFDSYSFTSGNDTESDVFRLLAGRSTMELTVRNSRAQVVQRETRVWDGSSWQSVSTETFGYSTAGFLTSHIAGNGAEYSATYDGELKTAETDPTGVAMSYTAFDAAGRVTASTRAGAGGAPDPVPALSSSYTYDAAGRLRTRTDASTAAYTWDYDTAGRMTSQSVPGPNGSAITTGYVYSSLASGYSRQTNLPTTSGSRTRVKTYHPDGRLASVTGTAVIHQYFDYTLDSGRHKTTAYVGSSGNSRRSETWTDWLGRTTKTSQPGFSVTSQAAAVAEFFYSSSTGQLNRSTREGYAATLYEYDAMGRLRRSGLDVTASTSLTDGSLDRITESDLAIEQFASAWWIKESTHTFFGDNSATKTRVATTRTRLSGFSGNMRGETRFWDADYSDSSTTDQTRRDLVEIDRTNKTVTLTTYTAGISTAAVTTIVNGLTHTERGHDNVTFTHAYDGLLRRIKTTNPRTGTGDTTISYKGATELVYQITTPASTVTEYEYDNIGRVTAFLPESGKRARTEYDTLGRAFRQWGDVSTPVEYGFDITYGDQTTITTFRSGTGWNGSTWPGGSGDTTTFTYDAPSGLVSTKSYAGTTGTVTFQYNSRRQLSKRIWARDSGSVYTDYSYDGSTGELAGANHSDATPDVSYAYTRAGQLKTAGDTTVGTYTFTYDSSKPWRLDRQELPAYLGSRWLSPLYESTGLIGRVAGFELGTSSDRDADLRQDWQYEGATGRFDKILSAAAGGTARTFDYSYVSDSSLVGGLAIINPDGGASSYSVTRAYDARDLLSSITQSWSSSDVAKFEYGYTARGQRDWEKRSGTSFALDALKVTTDFQYNDRGELTKALAYRGESMVGTAKLPNLQHEYEYDEAGNRKAANQTGDPARKDSFTANALNQIVARDNKSVIASGTVNSSAGVALAINSGTPVAADRQGSYWSKALTPDNDDKADSPDISIVAGQGTGAWGTQSRTTFVGHDSQTLQYDADGNLKQDGPGETLVSSVWSYTWDAENRLIAASTTAKARNDWGYPAIDVTYVYDYAGRRVQKRVIKDTVETCRRYIYDGWNLIAEYEVTGGGTTFGSLKRSYTWGLDIQGSLAATGGVGALLQLKDHTSGDAYFPAHDGNGNVMALYDSSTGSSVAVYEYSPFGDLTRMEGDYAIKNPIRFSSKFADDDTGLIYYGYRYYSPSLGRFINRDPIGEAGGANIYGFSANDPTNMIDILGLTEADMAGRAWDGRVGMPDSANMPFFGRGEGAGWGLTAIYGGYVEGFGSAWQRAFAYTTDMLIRDAEMRAGRAGSQRQWAEQLEVGQRIDRILVYRNADMQHAAQGTSGSRSGVVTGATAPAYPNSPLLDRLPSPLPSPDKRAQFQVYTIDMNNLRTWDKEKEKIVWELIDRLRNLKNKYERLTQIALLIRKLEATGQAGKVALYIRFGEIAATRRTKADGSAIPVTPFGIPDTIRAQRPGEKTYVKVTTDGDARDSLASLAHEIAHAVQYVTGEGLYGKPQAEIDPTRIGNEVYEALNMGDEITDSYKRRTDPGWNTYIPWVREAPKHY